MLDVSQKQPDPKKQTPFGKAVQRLRERKGLTKEMLADLVGVTRLTVGNIENGNTRQPKRDVAKKIADEFKVSIESLYDGTAGLTGSETTAVNSRSSDRGSESVDSVPIELARLLLERGKVDGITDDDIAEILDISMHDDRGQKKDAAYYAGILAALRRPSKGPTKGGGGR